MNFLTNQMFETHNTVFFLKQRIIILVLNHIFRYTSVSELIILS